jgi:hypothetical protein
MPMFNWRKRGLVFDPRAFPGRPWMHRYAQAPATLVFDDFVRVYFSTRPGPDAQGRYVSYSAFVDLDRNDLSCILRVADEPILDLGGLGTFDEFGVYPVSVIRDNGDVLAFYGGWTRCESIPFTVSIGLAKSADDGTTFQRVGPGPLLTCNYREPFVLSGPKIRKYGGKWHLWYVAGTKWHVIDGRVEAVFKIRHAVSDDALNWIRDHQDTIEPVLEPDECQASPDVVLVDGRYHMFFCYKYSADFRGNRRGYRIGYAWSSDLRTWHREDSAAGLTFSDEGWDSKSVGYPHALQLDDHVHLLYIGNDFGRDGFGLASIALDDFRQVASRRG